MFRIPKKIFQSSGKFIIMLVILIVIIQSLRKILTQERIKRIQPFQTLIVIAILVVAFYIGLFYVTKDGDAFYIALYPLYVVIFVATFASIKNRSHEIGKVKREYLLKEFFWGNAVAVIVLLALVYINLHQKLAAGIILAFNLLFIGFLFNLGLIYYALKKKK